MTALGSLLAVLAGLLRDLTQLAVSPSGITALAATVLAGAMFAAVLALLVSVAGVSRATAAIPMIRRASRAAGEVLARGVPAPARSRRGGTAQAQSTIGGPGGRQPPLTGSHLADHSAAASSPHPVVAGRPLLMFSLLGVPVDAAYHLVSGFTGILTPVLGGLAAVAAIIVVTMAVRILLMPLSLRALRGQAAAARLAPQLQALRQRYARQPERLQQEMSALYKREGTSMFAGITPLLLQWPFLSVMYLLFRSPQVGGKPNTLLAHDLFGVPLGMHWLSGAGPASLQGAVFLGVFALLAGLCWLSARLARAAATGPRPEAARATACRPTARRRRGAGQGAAVPDRSDRRVRAARGGDLPAHVDWPGRWPSGSSSGVPPQPRPSRAVPADPAGGRPDRGSAEGGDPAS